MNFRYTILGAVGILVTGVGLVAVSRVNSDPEKPAAAREVQVDYIKDVRPILAKNCFKCHGADKQRGGLRLDLKREAFKGGDDFGPAVVPGKSADSPLFQFISRDDADLKMPPEGPRLSREQLTVLRSWIDQGAKWPDAGDTGTDHARHWSFIPVIRPSLSKVAREEWSHNPIDRFVLLRLEREGLPPAPKSDRTTLIRRLSFDLVGLPPTPEEVASFVADTAPDAYERLVDRLLDSPHFGERWARHWLDAVRFAESDGFETNQPRPNAWPYRDYVIRAFNDDKPYDRFLIEQLAGDTLGEDAATGFIVGGAMDGVKSPDPVLTAQQRADELHDMVSTTGSAFLGLTVGCARCHAHKFDPISQVDYYAMKAVFAGVQHGERPLQPAADPARHERVTRMRGDLAEVERKLQRFEPTAVTSRTIVITPETASRVTPLVTPLGTAKYQPGTERGQADDAGDAARLPNLGRGYLYWKTAGRDLCTFAPGVAGTFHIWLSWGCGEKTHATDARFFLDRDGRAETTDDRTEIAVVDQQKFADGSGDAPGQPLWSGFLLAGTHLLTPESKLILRGGDQEAYVTVDTVLLEEIGSEPTNPKQAKTNRAPSPEGKSAANLQPHFRVPVTRGKNVERFSPVLAKVLRLTVLETSQLEPCLDELEVFTAGTERKNVALATAGTRATASSTLPGYDIHKLEHVNDGLYGNSRSWISNERGAGWIQLEFAEPLLIDRVLWSRDREEVPRYNDRLATRYRIEVALQPDQWRVVASSDDRLPFGSALPGGEIYSNAGLDREEAGQYRQLIIERDQLKGALQALEKLPLAYAGRFTAPEPTFRLHRGDPMQPKEPVTPGGLTTFGGTLPLAADTPERERRLALARWIADSKNPLTARVVVNRLWQQHFGEGLVATPSDFGLNGVSPSHPELLDWLAAELVEHGWSLKHIHRLIVLSNAYRQSSASNSAGMAKDAGSRLLWRYPPRRVEAELVRDAVLAVSGKLNPAMGGPGFDLFDPNTNYVKVYNSKKQFGPDEWRRMVYQSKPRMQLEDTFGAFDCPDAGQIAPKRTRSTTPLQALNLLNSTFMIEQSRFFADRLEREAPGDVGQQVRRGFWLAFQRTPVEEELIAGAKLVRDEGLLIFCRALFNANEFLMVY